MSTKVKIVRETKGLSNETIIYNKLDSAIKEVLGILDDFNEVDYLVIYGDTVNLTVEYQPRPVRNFVDGIKVLEGTVDLLTASGTIGDSAFLEMTDTGAIELLRKLLEDNIDG